MRTVADIERDIASTEASLRKLHAERRDFARNRISVVVAKFDAGMDTSAISEAMGIGYSTVQGILWREGRTEKGRTAIKARLREHRDGQGVSA